MAADSFSEEHRFESPLRFLLCSNLEQVLHLELPVALQRVKLRQSINAGAPLKGSGLEEVL